MQTTTFEQVVVFREVPMLEVFGREGLKGVLRSLFQLGPPSGGLRVRFANATAHLKHKLRPARVEFSWSHSARADMELGVTE